MRKSKASTTAIENIFITRTTNYITNPPTNGLSDHEAQITVIENTVLITQRNNNTTNRDINDQSILEFQFQHLNGLGKDKLAKQLVSLTYKILHQKKVPPITLSWISDQGHSDSQNQ